MKKLALLATLLFSVMFSSASYAEWKKVGVSEVSVGAIVYVDLERIKKVDGYVYFWVLIDYLKLTKQGHLSVHMYKQGDCKLFRSKSLSYSFHKEPMGGGTSETARTPQKEWTYPHPNSISEISLNSICDHVK